MEPPHRTAGPECASVAPASPPASITCGPMGLLVEGRPGRIRGGRRKPAFPLFSCYNEHKNGHFRSLQSVLVSVIGPFQTCPDLGRSCLVFNGPNNSENASLFDARQEEAEGIHFQGALTKLGTPEGVAWTYLFRQMRLGQLLLALLIRRNLI